MITLILQSSFKTFNSKQKSQKAQKNEKLDFQKNRQKMQTYINPFEKNNDHTRIMRNQFVTPLRILTEKKHRQIKLQRLQKVRIWTFGQLVHQIKSLKEVLKLKQNLHKNKVITGKTPFFVVGPF